MIKSLIYPFFLIVMTGILSFNTFGDEILSRPEEADARDIRRETEHTKCSPATCGITDTGISGSGSDFTYKATEENRQPIFVVSGSAGGIPPGSPGHEP